QRSLAVRPTAEAHTFLGWALSYQGKHEEAIAECKRAIAVDPSFGNPYNDIGAYLIELGRGDEAVEWLGRAHAAPRHAPRPLALCHRVSALRRGAQGPDSPPAGGGPPPPRPPATRRAGKPSTPCWPC